MAGFKYFLPRVPLADVGPGGRLAHERLPETVRRALADVEVEGRDYTLSGVLQGGPGGQAGVVLTTHPVAGGDDETSRQYRPAKQHWLTSAEGDVWIGWEVDAPPRAADLWRRVRVEGYQINDDCEDTWLIPVARAPQHPYGYLPQTYTFNGQGRPVPHLKAAWRELWQRAGDLWEFYAWEFGRAAIEAGLCTPPPERPAEWDAAWLIQQAVWILGVNHRVGPLEINALFELDRPILDDTFKHAVCQAVCDFNFALEYLQKKTEQSPSEPAAAGSSYRPGGVAASAATAPASPGYGSLTS